MVNQSISARSTDKKSFKITDRKSKKNKEKHYRIFLDDKKEKIPQIDISWHQDVFDKIIQKAEYEALVATLESPRIFIGWDWLAASASLIKPARSHLTLVARDPEKKLIACISLTWGIEWHYGLPVRTLRMLGEPYADRVELVIATGFTSLLEQTLTELKQCPRPWDALYWSELVVTQNQRDRMSACLSRDLYRLIWRHSSHCPVLAMDTPSPPTPRRSSVRRELQRRSKKLHELGAIELEHIQPAPDDVDRLIEEVKVVEDQSWKGTKAIGLLSNPGRQALFRDLFVRLACRSELIFSQARLDGRLVGYCIGFIHHGDYLYYSPGYLPEMARHGVGRLLLADLITHAHQQGWSCVDASRTALRVRHPLEDWATEFINHEQLRAYRGTVRGRLLYLMEQIVKPPAKQIWLWLQERIRTFSAST